MKINFIGNGSQSVRTTQVGCSGKFCFLAVVCNLIFHTEETNNNLGLGLCMKKDISKATPDVYQGKGSVSKCF